MSILSLEDNASREDSHGDSNRGSPRAEEAQAGGASSAIQACNAALLDLVNRLHDLRAQSAVAGERGGCTRGLALSLSFDLSSGGVSVCRLQPCVCCA